MTAYCWVYDYACVLLLAWWKVVTAYHWVHDYACCDFFAVTCRLTAEYGISSIPQHSTYVYGTHLYLRKLTTMVIMTYNIQY